MITITLHALTNVLLIWVQTACKGYQGTTFFVVSKERKFNLNSNQSNGRAPLFYRYSRHGFHEESQGSGFIVKKDGLILTNAHVVRDNGQITVKMKNGREFIGTVHAVDKISDLATIKINAVSICFKIFVHASCFICLIKFICEIDIIVHLSVKTIQWHLYYCAWSF